MTSQFLYRRREFITLVGGAAAGWPLVVNAQRSATATIGVLAGTTREDELDLITAFVTSLRQAGFVEGSNVAFEYRFADNRFDRLPSLAADLVRRQVSVIATLGGTITVLAAKAATQTVPIVFVTGGDPIKAGLVASLNRPGSNITGISLLGGALNEKRLQLLHEVVPKATQIALLHNPNNPNGEPEVRLLTATGQGLGLSTHTFEASTINDIETVYAEMAGRRVEALVVLTDPFLNDRFSQIVAQSARHAIPAIYGYREFTTAGGLMSYGTSHRDARRQAGLLVARILRGESPADLPVQQATKVELVINLRTAKTLGINFPLSLLGRADEVIE